MRGLFPRDPLLVGRFGAFLGAVAWLSLGGQGILPIAAAALVLLVATAARVWWLDRRRGTRRHDDDVRRGATRHGGAAHGVGRGDPGAAARCRSLRRRHRGADPV